MAIPLDDYDKILEKMPKRGKGDQAELSEDDERALDAAWKKIGEEKSEKSDKSFA